MNLSLKFLFDNIDVSFLVLDPYDRIIKFNQIAQKYFLLSKKDLRHKKIHELFSNLDIENLKDFFLKNRLKIVKRTPGLRRNEKTGASISIVPLFDEKNAYSGSIVSCTDISDKLELINQGTKAREEFIKRTAQIAEERDKFYLVIENISDGVLLLDYDYNIILVNSSLEKIIGIDTKKLMGTHLKIYFKEIYYSELIRKKYYFQSEIIEITNQKEKSRKAVSVYMAPLITQRGESMNTVLTLRDITREKQIDDMKTQFVSNVSHELRTPLASIKGFTVTLLARKELSEQQKNKFLTIINNESDRLTRLVEDLLSLSRIESSSFRFQISEFSLVSMLEELKQEMEKLLMKKKLRLDIIIPAGIPPLIADRDMIFQLLLNLINNAIKLTKESTVILFSTIFRKKDKSFIFTIKDQGPGISRENIEKIFDKFFRVEDSVHIIPGTGLGLSIVKSIVEKHRGEINVRSRLGKGATFIVRIPQGRISEEEET